MLLVLGCIGEGRDLRSGHEQQDYPRDKVKECSASHKQPDHDGLWRHAVITKAHVSAEIEGCTENKEARRGKGRVGEGGKKREG